LQLEMLDVNHQMFMQMVIKKKCYAKTNALFLMQLIQKTKETNYYQI